MFIQKQVAVLQREAVRMLRKVLKYIYVFAAVYAVMLFAASASAESVSKVINNFSYAALKDSVMISVDGFNQAGDLWKAGKNSASVTNVSTVSVDPEKVFEGVRCAEIRSADARAGEWRYLEKSFNEPLDLSSSGTLFYAVNCQYLTDGEYYTDIILYSGEKSYSVPSKIKSSGWNGVFADISDFAQRDSVDKIVIGICHEYDGELNWSYSFQLDCLCAVEDGAYLSARFLSDSISVSGGEAVISDSGIHIAVSEDGMLVEPNTRKIYDEEGANAVSLSLVNRAGFKSVTMQYVYDGSSFSRGSSMTLELEDGDEPQRLYFAVGEIPEKVRFVFNGASSGSIDITSITVSSGAAAREIYGGSIDACFIANNRKEIMVTGTMSPEALEKYKNCRIALFETEHYTVVNDQFFALRDYIVTTDAGSRFAFKIPLYDGDRSRLNSVFAVGVISGGKVLPLTDTKFINNPEVLAAEAPAYSVGNSKKGLRADLSTVQERGAKSTVIEIRADRLLTLDSSKLPFTASNGKKYYFDTDYIAELDSNIRVLYEAGVNVTASVVLYRSDNASENRLLVHPAAKQVTTACAFNTVNADGVGAYTAIFEFLASRYSSGELENGRIVNYVVGSGVNYPSRNYNAGGMTLNEFIENYAGTFRIAYNSVRSYSGEGAKVYISLGCGWDEELPASYESRYDNRAFVDGFAKYISDGGDIQWNLAYDPYPANAYSYISFIDEKSSDSFDADRVTIKNIDMLCRYFSRDALLYEEQPRSIILIESTFCYFTGEEELTKQSADFVYAYYKLNSSVCELIDSFIVYRLIDYNNVFKYIDTTRSSEVVSFVSEVIGENEWKRLTDGYDAAEVVSRSVQETELLASLPISPKGSFPLWESGSNVDDTSGWSAADNCVSVASGGNLTAVFRGAVGSEYCGIVNSFGYSIDFSTAPYLELGITLLGLQGNTDSAELQIFVYSNDSYMMASGTVYRNKTNTVVFDMSGFEGISSVDRIKIRLRGETGGSLGEFTAAVSSMRLVSDDYTDDELKNYLQLPGDDTDDGAGNDGINYELVWTLVLIIVVTLAVGAINIMGRMREKGQ